MEILCCGLRVTCLRRSSVVAILFFLIAISATSTPVLAQTPSVDGYVIFGDSLVTIESFTDVTSGLVGSNHLVAWDSGKAVEGVTSGGDIIGAFDVGTPEKDGMFVAQESIHYGSFLEVHGNIEAGGNVVRLSSLSSFDVQGSVIAGGTVDWNDFFSDVTGSVVNGAAPPPSVEPKTMPAAAVFTPGNADLITNTFAETNLAPGSYGNVILGGANTLGFTAGDYYIDTLMADDFLNLTFDLTGGPINVYVANNVVLEHTGRITVNGVEINDPFNPAPDTFDTGLASLITFESGKSIHYGGDFFGTLFAPNGTIVLDAIGSIRGALIADTIDMGGSGNAGGAAAMAEDNYAFIHEPSARLFPVPEPSTLAMAGIALLACLATARHRRQTTRRW